MEYESFDLNVRAYVPTELALTKNLNAYPFVEDILNWDELKRRFEEFADADTVIVLFEEKIETEEDIKDVDWFTVIFCTFEYMPLAA